jgi:hypothetical protein
MMAKPDDVQVRLVCATTLLVSKAGLVTRFHATVSPAGF